MSISNPTLKNPCKKFIEFKGDKGQFFYYDKEEEKQIEVPAPFYFVVLDELSTITGYNKTHDCGIYSNEVHSTVHRDLHVKTFKGGESLKGKYINIRAEIIALGGKYTKSVYAIMVNPHGTFELVNFQFKGAAFSGWLDKKINVEKSIIGVSEFRQEKNGNITYQVPVFKAFKMTDEAQEVAIQTDKHLQDYFKNYKAQQEQDDIPVTPAEIVEVIEENGSASKEAIVNASKDGDYGTIDDDLPF